MITASVMKGLNHANIAWASTNKSKLKKRYNQQKDALWIIINKNKQDSVSCLFNEIKSLNFFKINIFQTLLFMCKTKNQLNPTIFGQKFQVLHITILKVFQNIVFMNQIEKEISEICNIISNSPCLWNKILPVLVKGLDTLPLLKAK